MFLSLFCCFVSHWSLNKLHVTHCIVHSLGMNHIGDAGAERLAEALLRNTTLKVLEYVTIILQIEINNECVYVLICSAFAHSYANSLWYNEIGEAGELALDNALNQNSALDWLKYGPLFLMLILSCLCVVLTV